MLHTQGEVIRNDQGELVMQAECQEQCKSCGAQKICSGSSRTLALALDASQQQHYHEGQRLQMDLNEDELLRLTLLAYALPCILLLVLALLAAPFGDLATALGAILGLGLGIGISSLLIRRHPPRIVLSPLDHGDTP